MLKDTVIFTDYNVTTDFGYIIIQAGIQKVRLVKTKLKGLSITSKTPPILDLLGDGDTGASYSFKYSVTNTKVNGVLQTSIGMFETTMSGELKIGIPEIFVATVAQTAFPTTFLASASNVRIYVDGIRNSTLSGWTFPAGVPTYAAGMVGGETVLIEKLY